MDDAPLPLLPSESEAGPGIRWDDATIHREAAHLPEPLREAYRYLKSFTRDRCSKEVDLLVQAMRKLGITVDKTTWSKILRGRMCAAADGHPLVNPVLAEDKFLRYVAALQTNTREEALRGKVGFVETTVFQEIERYIDLKVSRDTVNRFGIIIGPTGTGKTASFKEYHRRRNHGRTWWFEAPAGGALGEFVNRMATISGLSPQTNLAKKRAHLLKVIQEEKVIIIDNAQDLYGKDRENLGAFNFLRQLQDETGCCVILSITPTFEKELTSGVIASYFEQFVGRSGGTRKWLRLPAYPPEEDVLMIAEAFGLRDAKRHLKTLVEISREPGRIRRLFDDLQDAKRLASAGKQGLTLDHLVEIRGED